MSGPRITDAAVEAGVSPLMFGYAHPQDQMAEDIVKDVLTAALPHIRRAVIEELVGKAETEKYPDTYGAFRRAARFHIVEWLRAELEGDE